MDDIRELITSKAAAMWRRRWWGALAVWIVCVAAALILYEARRQRSVRVLDRRSPGEGV